MSEVENVQRGMSYTGSVRHGAWMSPYVQLQSDVPDVFFISPPTKLRMQIALSSRIS